MDLRRSTPRLDSASRSCQLDFRPRRYFGCRTERVLAEFFRCDEPNFSGLSSAFRELTQGTIRPSFDDRVLLKASFAPTIGSGRVTLSVYYRLPTEDGAIIVKVLRAIERISCTSGYYRMSRGCELSLRGSIRVRTTVLGKDAGESYLATCIAIHLEAVPPHEAQAFGKQAEGPQLTRAEVPGE